MKLAVMQPYLCPYIGYFQLINAVDVFVFYDDVDYIKNGWINRNRILMNGKSHYITVPCRKASSNKLINSIQYDSTTKDYRKIVKTIKQAYGKEPFFEKVYFHRSNFSSCPAKHHSRSRLSRDSHHVQSLFP